MKFKYPTFDSIVEFNKQEVTRSSEEFRVEDEARLRNILEDVRNQGEHLPAQDALIKKASFMLFRITLVQPFYEGNKRTAYVAAKAFLNANGYSFKVLKDEIFEILEGIVFGRISLNHVETWIKERLIKL